MQTENPFLYGLLTPYDQIKFVNAFKTGLKILGKEKCWCMKRIKHSAFEGFNTSKKNKLQYQGRDARELLLYLTGREPTPERSIIVRKGYCESPYCLNPAHYYWGTRKDVAYENASTKENSINTFLISKLRKESQQGISSRKLSKTYRLPYHSVRRICSYETYEDAENRNNEYNEKEIWDNLSEICEKISLSFPEESKKYKLNFLVNQQLECPWHIKDTKTHIGNFGIMGECLDCMKQIKSGRCVVDVREFDFRWYWQVKRFWEQVDVKDEDSCWVWKGATRKNNSESTAYFPSPFHSGKTQSAPRVAFWLSRGYTGKYRIFSKPTCQSFCCNPKHLTIKELKDFEEPKKITSIKLSHDNIFEYYKNRQKPSCQKCPDS